MNGDIIVTGHGDPARLIESIREDAAGKIGAIEDQARNEIRRIDEECDAEIEAFERERGEETAAAIEKAVAIMKNRAAIEKRKMRLNAVEGFMRAMVDEAVAGFMANDRNGYASFLEKLISETLRHAGGHDLVIRLCPGDAGLKQRLLGYITGAPGYRGAVSILVDETIAGGGIVVEDTVDGVVYNCTVERIVARAYDALRNEVAAIVQRHLKEQG